jgi:hypothetical protein
VNGWARESPPPSARRRAAVVWGVLEWILLGFLVGAASGATLLAHGWRP